jgi:SAM-dependent methyltransferase
VRSPYRQLADAFLLSLGPLTHASELGLDVGCVHERSQWQPGGGKWYGLDVEWSPECLMREGSADGIPWPKETFDLVKATDVLYFLPDLGRGLRECARVAKPSGRLVVTLPFVRPHGESPRLNPKYYDRWRVTEWALRELATDAGWQIDRLEALGGPLTCLLQILYDQTYPHRRAAVLSRLTGWTSRWDARRRPLDAGRFHGWTLGFGVVGSRA